MVTVKHNVVEFNFLRPKAHSVCVAGDFNGWRRDDLPMTKSRQGFWKAKIRLPQGTFRFRYLADGQWYTDFAAFGVEPGPYGPVGVVYVPESKHISHRTTHVWNRTSQVAHQVDEPELLATSEI
jgi:1,4-alpha-glucan branching enzyme